MCSWEGHSEVFGNEVIVKKLWAPQCLAKTLRVEQELALAQLGFPETLVP